MLLSRRKELDDLPLENCTNASLLMSFMLEGQDQKDKGKNQGDTKKESSAAKRKELLASVSSALQNLERSGVYEQAFNNHMNDLKEVDADTITMQTADGSALAAGIGGTHILETGLTLNPLFGTPMIPASSIKGVVAHYCDAVLGGPEHPEYCAPEFDDSGRLKKNGGKLYDLFFGHVADPNNPDDKDEAGYFRFYDAWLTPDSLNKAIVTDVMTPHHGDYYSGQKSEPSDFDDPNPILFLTVQGKFEIPFDCEEYTEKREETLEFLRNLISFALMAEGVGGKTRAGYGHLYEPELKQRLEQREKEKKEKAKAELETLERQVQKDKGFHSAGDTVVVVGVTEKKKQKFFAMTLKGEKIRAIFPNGSPKGKTDGQEFEVRLLEAGKDEQNPNIYVYRCEQL